MNFERAKTYVLQRARASGVDAEVLATATRELTLAASGGRVDEISHAHQGAWASASSPTGVSDTPRARP